MLRNALTATIVAMLLLFALAVRASDLPLEIKSSVPYTVVVDHDRALDRMIAENDYDNVNANIGRASFPPDGKGKVETVMQLLKSNQPTSSTDVVNWMNEQGLRPATFRELLEFSEKYRDQYGGFQIAALGSSLEISGARFVPVSGKVAGAWMLVVRPWGNKWGTECGFVAVVR